VLDYRQSEEYCRYFLNSGWQVEKADDTKILIKKLPLLGNIIKIQRCNTVPFRGIEKIAKRDRTLFAIVEAATTTEDITYIKVDTEFKVHGYKNLKLRLCPTKTVYINLTKSEDEILAGFDASIKKTIKRNQNEGVTTKITDSFEKIYPLLQEAGKRRHFFVQSYVDWKKQWGAFGAKTKVILAYKDGELLGGNMFLVATPTAFGLFLPTTSAGRSLHVAATLLWEGLKIARANGCTTFDLEGIYDDRFHAPKKWLGLTKFKRKFKGREVEFIPAKIKIFAWYFKPLGWLGLL